MPAQASSTLGAQRALPAPSSPPPSLLALSPPFWQQSSSHSVVVSQAVGRTGGCPDTQYALSCSTVAPVHTHTHNFCRTGVASPSSSQATFCYLIAHCGLDPFCAGICSIARSDDCPTALRLCKRAEAVSGHHEPAGMRAWEEGRVRDRQDINSGAQVHVAIR
jgi:hypothetical protein